jgi:translation initiation factor 1
MNPFNSMIGDIEAELTGKGSSKQKMHLRLQQRNGKKCVTIFQHLSPELDPKSLAKEMKKKFSCGGSIQKDDEDHPVLVLFGDQRQNIIEYLTKVKNVAEPDDFVIHGY